MAQRDGAAVDVDLAHVKLQLARHGDGLGGESLVGLDQINVLDGNAGLFHGLTGSGDGAHAHDLGIHAALPPANELGHGLQAVFLHSLAGGQHDGGRAVVDAGGGSSGDAGSALVVGFLRAGQLKGMYHLWIGRLGTHGEGALHLHHALHGGAGAGEFVLLEVHKVLLDLHGDGDNLVVELAGGLRGFALLLGGDGKLVLLLAGNAPHVANVLSGGAHVVVVVCVPQAVLDHGVHQLLVAHAGAPAGIGSHVGSSGHVLRAAADHHVGVAGQNGACTLDDRLHTGAADHAHGVGGNGIGNAGLDGHLPGHVLAQACGEDAAEHDLIHLLGLYACAV